MEYHEQLWVSAYKGVQTQEVKMVNWSAKSFVSMCEEWKSWNFFFFFLPFLSSSLETLNQKKQIIFIF